MEFKEFCSNFNRMVDECEEQDNPFVEASQSEYVEDWLTWTLNNPEEAEDFVATWTKHNPAPVYPTFLEMLEDMTSAYHELRKTNINDLMHQRIPQEVAEKYGIAPLNLCNITKYAEVDNDAGNSIYRG